MSMDELNRMSWLMEERRAAFRDASALYGYTFEGDNGAVPQMEQARQYAAHWEKMQPQGLGLLFWGLPGNGKTFAAASIANALLEQWVKVRMTTLGEVLNRLPTLNAEDKLLYLKDLKTCGLLILDDFGMERRTDYAREQIFSIIDGRYVSKRPLIVTTNLSLKDLKTPADVTEQRIYDRVLEMCVPVCFEGESLRQGRAKENMKLYKQLISK